jgi:hypothetical protein
MYLLIYVCMHACMYVCMYVRVCAYVYIHFYVYGIRVFLCVGVGRNLYRLTTGLFFSNPLSDWKAKQ